jgi:hypothetical protein
MPIIPDLRFEQTYLRSISAHLHRHAKRERMPYGSTVSGEDTEWKKVMPGWEHDKSQMKGKENPDMITAVQEPSASSNVQSADILHPRSFSPRMVRIDWGGVAWVTTRDQLISPLLQGALW